MLGRVGIAGCGRMGRPMLIALREAGIDAAGFDIRHPSEFGSVAAQVTDDARAFAPDLDVLISCVRDAGQTEAMLFGEEGLIGRAEKLQYLVVCSTLSPAYVREMRARVPVRVRLIDAAMEGSEATAKQKTTTFLMGGSIGDLDHLHTMFTAMGRYFHWVGPFGSGMVAKGLMNLTAAGQTALMAQMLSWAEDAGIERETAATLLQAAAEQGTADALGGHARGGTGRLVELDAGLDARPPNAERGLAGAVRDALVEARPALRVARSA